MLLTVSAKDAYAGINDISVDDTHEILYFTDVWSMRSLSQTCSKLHGRVKTYFAIRFRRFMRHFFFRNSFVHKVLGDHRAFLSGFGAIALALNLDDYGSEIRLVVDEHFHSEAVKELAFSGYVHMSCLTTVYDVLSLSPILFKKFFLKGNAPKHRMLELVITRGGFPPELAMTVSYTLASMIIVTNTSITTFFPELFFQQRTAVRRIPTAIDWAGLHQWSDFNPSYDIPPPISREARMLHQKGFEVAYAFFSNQRETPKPWGCPRNAFKMGPLFTTMSTELGVDDEDIWKLRHTLGKQTQLIQWSRRCQCFECGV